MLDLTEPEIHAAYKSILMGDSTDWYDLRIFSLSEC